MIGSFAEKLTKRLIENGSVSEGNRELYVYGFFMLFSHAAYFALTVIFGLLLMCPVQSIVFFVAFQFVRRFAGGYHADTEIKCTVLSVSTIFISILMCRLARDFDFSVYLTAPAAVSALLTAVFCPLDTPSKPLSAAEKKRCRKISLLITAVICALICLSAVFRLELILSPLCLALILEGILIAAGKLQNFSQNKKGKI